MLYGIGIDNVELSRITCALERSDSFARKVCTDEEFAKFQYYKTLKARTEFLAGLWAAKEAYSKAYGTGYSHGFTVRSVSVANDSLGKPFFSHHPFSGVAQLSISHDGAQAVAIVTLETIKK